MYFSDVSSNVSLFISDCIWVLFLGLVRVFLFFFFFSKESPLCRIDLLYFLVSVSLCSDLYLFIFFNFYFFDVGVGYYKFLVLLLLYLTGFGMLWLHFHLFHDILKSPSWFLCRSTGCSKISVISTYLYNLKFFLISSFNALWSEKIIWFQNFLICRDF